MTKLYFFWFEINDVVGGKRPASNGKSVIYSLDYLGNDEYDDG